MAINKNNYWAHVTSKESTATKVKELNVTIHYINGDHTTRDVLEQKMILAAIQSLQETGALPVIPQEYEQSLKQQSYNQPERCRPCNQYRMEEEYLCPFRHSAQHLKSNQEQPANDLHICISFARPL